MIDRLQKLKEPTDLEEPKSIEDKVVEWLKLKVNPAEITRILAAAIDCEIEDREDAVSKLNEEIQEAIKNGDLTAELRIKDGTIVNSHFSEALRTWMRKRMVDGLRLNTPENIGKWVLTMDMDSTMTSATGEEINEQLNADLTPLVETIGLKEASYDGDGKIEVTANDGSKVSVKLPVAGFGGNKGLIASDELNEVTRLKSMGIYFDPSTDTMTIGGKSYKLTRQGVSFNIYAGWYMSDTELTAETLSLWTVDDILATAKKKEVFTTEPYYESCANSAPYKNFLYLYPIATADTALIKVIGNQIRDVGYSALIRPNVFIEGIEYKVLCLVPGTVTSYMEAYVTLKEL